MSKLKDTDNIPAGTHLTVIIRDDAPLIHSGDTPSYRRVTIGLDANQVAQMMLKPTWQQGETVYHESVSTCFLEE